MKIDGLMGDIINKYSRQAKVADKANSAKTKQQKEMNPEVSRTSKDSVEISDNAKILLQIEGNDENRAEKINKVKTAIGSGTYKPDVEETAKSILREWEGE